MKQMQECGGPEQYLAHKGEKAKRKEEKKKGTRHTVAVEGGEKEDLLTKSVNS